MGGFFVLFLLFGSSGHLATPLARLGSLLFCFLTLHVDVNHGFFVSASNTTFRQTIWEAN